MQAEALLEALLALARETGLAVRRVGAAAAGEGIAPTASALCRVRGELWVVLVDSDPAPRRAAVLARGLRVHAPQQLEGRYLPPAVRACLEAAPET
ncbi:MAG: hypothetical protein OEW02_06670 [Myxococcales bacterium]|nr:hypothetical protein [Myxococcales bacterium]MDH5566492.1 hypothetical protein [Myxococcales bacterium]